LILIDQSIDGITVASFIITNGKRMKGDFLVKYSRIFNKMTLEKNQ
jgi:hypothetical protein